ncbi:Hypothetical protein POVN_LOCUS45 [uncultured virus]|nr:Hypothetical protein POVN_LOCUS45 [uncultured virus]
MQDQAKLPLPSEVSDPLPPIAAVRSREPKQKGPSKLNLTTVLGEEQRNLVLALASLERYAKVALDYATVEHKRLLEAKVTSDQQLGDVFVNASLAHETARDATSAARARLAQTEAVLREIAQRKGARVTASKEKSARRRKVALKS